MAAEGRDGPRSTWPLIGTAAMLYSSLLLRPASTFEAQTRMYEVQIRPPVRPVPTWGQSSLGASHT